MLLPRVLSCTRAQFGSVAARHSVVRPPLPLAVHRMRLLSTDASGKAAGSEAEAAPAAEPVKEAPDADATAQAAEGAEDAPSPEVVIETLEARVAELDAKLTEKHDQVLRALAEADNARRRADLDVQSAHKFGIGKFAKDLLEVADNLSRAAESVPENVRTSDEHPELKALYEGVVMVDKVLLKTFEKHGARPFASLARCSRSRSRCFPLRSRGRPPPLTGLTRVEPMGEKFDPNFHEALFKAPDPTKEPDTIMHVANPGYVLHERCLRAAGVGVVAKP
jgi:molecular chaperone GrpE